MFRRSRPCLALLLGAGLSGGFISSTLAGDKIEFTSLDSETLATPTVDRAESEPASVFSGLSLKDPLPQPEGLYPVRLPSPVAPARRNENRISRNENDGLSSDLAGTGQNGSAENPAWETFATNNSSKPASGNLDEAAWGKPQNPDALERGADKAASRYSPADSRLGSQTSLERRDRQNSLEAAITGAKPWATRKENASSSGAKTPIADLLEQQKQAFSGASFGLFRPLPQFADPSVSSAWGAPSTPRSDSSLISPLDSTETGYNNSPDRESSLPSGKNSGNQGPGNSSGLPSMRSWGDPLGGGFQPSDPAQARKPLSDPQAGSQRPPVGPILAWPKKPGSTFN